MMSKNSKFQNSLEIKLQIPKNVGMEISKALDIESKDYEMRKYADVKINYLNDREILNITIKADDISSLRAAMNTYLKWIIMCQELLKR